MSRNQNVEIKDSGIEWIGEIPKHWSLKKITHVTPIIGSGTTPKSDNKDYYEDGNINWLVTGDLNDGYVFQTSNKVTQKALDELSSLKIYPENSLLIAMYGATIGKLGILKTETTVNQATCVLKFDDSNSIDFWFYVFVGNRNYLVSLGYGGGQPNISQDVIKSLRFPSPPTLEEQKLISLYLDKKTSQIDSLVEKIQKKIRLLKEQRTSLINQCVTKGIDPNVEMKDSGVEWIVEIPKHWKISKIKYERSKEKYSLVDGPFGSDLKSEHYVDNGDVFVIESGFVTKGSFQQTREFKTISKDHFEKIRRSECFEGDIIIAKIGEYYGMSSILPNLGRETVVSGNSCRLKISSENNVEFFHSVLLNLRYQGVIQREVNQTGQPFISLGVIDNLHVFVPPLEEQQEIVEYMSETISNIDRVITLTTRKIKFLSEYRQSLISSVVTGKVRVTEDMI